MWGLPGNRVPNNGYYRSVKTGARNRFAAACLAGLVLAACTSARMWLNEAGWPAYPAGEAQFMLSEARSLPNAPSGVEAAKKAAEFAFRRDLYSHALDATELWLTRDPSDLDAMALATVLRVAAGDGERALASARAGLSGSGTSERFLALFGERVSGVNREALPIGSLKVVTGQLAEEFSGSPSVLTLAARVALDARDYEGAIDYADKLAALDPGNDSAHALAATALLRAGDPDMALARLTELLASRDSEVLEQSYAMLLLEARQPREALSRLRELRTRNPNSPHLAMQQARMLQAVGLGNIAEPLFIELFALGYETDLCRVELGRIAYDRQDWLESIEWYAGIESDQLMYAAAYGMVEAFVRQEDYDEALATVLDLVRHHPEHTYESLGLVANIMQGAGRDRDALAAYEEGLRYRPDSLEFRLARATVLAELKRYRAAIRAMESLLLEYPRDANVLNALGYTLADRGIRLQEAHDHIRRALDLEPGSAAIIDSMGWVLYRLGRTEEALPLLEQALELTRHPEIAAHLCEVLYELGQTARADALLRESLREYRETTLLEAVRERYSR